MHHLTLRSLSRTSFLRRQVGSSLESMLRGSAAAVLLVAPASATNLLVDGGFEAHSCTVSTFLTLNSTASCLSPWAVLPGGGVNLVGSTWTAAEGQYSIELSGSSAGGIEQAFTTVPGQTYVVAFSLAGQPGGSQPVKTMRIEVDNDSQSFADFTFDTTGKNTFDMGWRMEQWCFAADSTQTTVSFRTTTPTGTYGAAIDNVQVSAIDPTDNIVTDSGFESNACVPIASHFQLSSNSTCLSPWEVLPGGGVFLVGGTWTAAEGSHSVELAGSSAGGIRQVLSTVPGQSYTVQFDGTGQPFGSNPVKTMRVEVDNATSSFIDFQFDTTGATYTNMAWISKSWTFTADSPSTAITFRTLSPAANFGAVVDNILISAECSHDCQPITYCTAKVSSAGCVAQIGNSSPTTCPISAANDYSVFATGIQGLKNGIMFFSSSGADALPFAGGTLCVLPPLGRAPIQNSGGSSPMSCDGSFSQLINDGGAVNINLDQGPGTSNWLQFWARDPQNGIGTQGSLLSNAMQLDFQ